MKKNLKLLSVLCLTMIMISCKKQDFNGLSDLRPAVPVTVTNAIDFRPEPTVGTSISAGGAIQITLAIPASSGRTIKEITRIAASTTYTAIQSGLTTGFYTTTPPFSPIPVNAATYTFNTSLSQYFAIHPVSASNPAAAANTELARRFYFKIILPGSIFLNPGYKPGVF